MAWHFCFYARCKSHSERRYFGSPSGKSPHWGRVFSNTNMTWWKLLGSAQMLHLKDSNFVHKKWNSPTYSRSTCTVSFWIGQMNSPCARLSPLTSARLVLPWPWLLVWSVSHVGEASLSTHISLHPVSPNTRSPEGSYSLCSPLFAHW